MTEMDVAPETRRRRASPALLLWLVGIVTIVFLEIVERTLDRIGVKARRGVCGRHHNDA